MGKRDDTTTFPQSKDLDPEKSLYGDELAPGAIAGEYVVEGTLAAGGCGTIYIAEHRVLGRRTAIKVLHRDLAASPEMIERFIREARAANLIRHPNIIDIYEFGQLQDGRPYFVMELLDGLTLDQLVERQGPFSPEAARDILEPICAGLRAAHEAGVVHRDLKASNVMVVTHKTPREVKLLDFGIAKLLQLEGAATPLTSVGRRLGTPTAMAPEQIVGAAVDERTDIYALGVLLFHLLTGTYPFQAEDPVEVERLHLEAPPPAPSERIAVPAPLDAVVLRCLEKSPERRYASVAAFLEALRLAVGKKRTLNPPSSHPAAGVYLEAAMELSSGENIDDALFDEIAEVIEHGKRVLSAAGFVPALATGNAFLGVLLLPAEAGARAAAKQHALEVALALRDELDRRPRRDPRLKLTVAAHADHAIVRTTSEGVEIAGGGLVRVTEWISATSYAGVAATPAMLADLPAEVLQSPRIVRI